MRQVHHAGDKLFIDYCGPTLSVVSPKTGVVRTAQVFVAVMGASSYTYAEATWTQSLPDWLGAHARAFTFFSGVPNVVVPDNLKSAVTKACRYDPELNPAYYQLAEHYGVAVIPARPYKPKDKAKAHLKHQEWSPQRFLRWAVEIGEHTQYVVEHQLSARRHPEHGYRAYLGLLNLAK